MVYKIEDLLQMAMQKGASDLHLKAGIVPVIRRHGDLRPLSSNMPALSGEQLESMAIALMSERQCVQFRETHEVDLSYGIAGLGRFRIHVFQQRGTIRMVIRNIPHTIPTIEELHLPKVLNKITEYERGLVLITGITGSGKSSTMASIMDEMNRRQNHHIITIEDPIEFLIRDRKSIVTQREIGIDALSYSRAMRAALRQDPDVIMIGEMRDHETIEIALTAAETGHLVLSTLHTLDAVEAINRIVSVFDMTQQDQVRMQLASVLKAIVSQRLARRKDNQGFVPAVEILINNSRIREMIEKRETGVSLHNVIEESHVTWGMQSFDQSLMDLITQDLISFEEALSLSTSPENFRVRYSGVTQMDGKKWSESSQHRQKIDKNWTEMAEVELEVFKELEAPPLVDSKRKKASGDE